jgi:hypothetical protein
MSVDSVSTKQLKPFLSHIVCAPLVKFLGREQNCWKLSVLVVSDQQDLDKFHSSAARKINYQSFTVHNLVMEFFQFQISLQEEGRSVDYAIYNQKFSLTVPGRADCIRMAFFSCNGFHSDEDEKSIGGIEKMWNHYTEVHTNQKAHLLLFGGDQEYFDPVFQLPVLEEWLCLPLIEKVKSPFTEEMEEEVDHFYLQKYLAKFAPDSSFAKTLSSTPSMMNWDDHDIFDGWGSYSTELQSCPVFQGIYASAKRYYLIFQQHVNPYHLLNDKSFIGNESFSMLRMVGDIGILAVDTRSKRNREEILPKEAWKEIFDATKTFPEQCRHLLVMLPVPIIYPDFGKLASLADKIEDHAGTVKKVVESFRSKKLKELIISPFETIELQDDMIDHWRSEQHKNERKMLIKKLQKLARNKNIRITFLSGDVHLGGMAEIFNPKVVSKEYDFQYMAQVISSPMGNIPGGRGIALFLSYFNNKTENFDGGAKAKLIPIENVDNSEEKILFSHRNWAELTYFPLAKDLAVDLFVESKKKQELTQTMLKVYSHTIPTIASTPAEPQTPNRSSSSWDCIIL